MVQAVRMPMMGNTMETGLLTEWVIDKGAEVAEDDTVAVVESEKAAADVAASRDGTLARVDVEAGEEVPPGTVLGVILGSDEDLVDAPEPRSRIEPDSGGDDETDAHPETADQSPESADKPADESQAADADIRAAPGARELAAEHGVDLASLDGTGPEGAILRADVEVLLDEASEDETGEAETAEPAGEPGRDFSSPSTRRLAREHGVSLADIEGTGIGDRVTESDVRAAASQLNRSSSASATNLGESGGVSGPAPSDADRLGVTITEERDLTGMRRTIAERMAQSARQAPHVTLNREVAVERAFETAEELASDRDAPIGFTDILIGATVRALDAYPAFNAWFEGDSLRFVAERNMAFAVDAEAGLVTPVIRSAAERSLDDIATERRRLTDAVLDGTHSMDDLQGGTFTITNLGMFGVDSFDPIINPPQVAILGVGAIRDGDDSRNCTLSLSFDHRVVDGADAARFLETLTESIESPSLVVADRASTGAGKRTASTADSLAAAEGGSELRAARVGEAVTHDVEVRAREVAAVHDWSLPSFEVRLDDGCPSVTVTASDDASPATMKRLTYAACRDSTYADTIVGLRDPDVTVV